MIKIEKKEVPKIRYTTRSMQTREKGTKELDEETETNLYDSLLI